MYIWYDDLLKWNGQMLMTLPAVLGCCSCIYVLIYAENTTSFTRSSCMCAVNETARLCHSLTEMQNMQDSYLMCFCGLIFIDTSPLRESI